MLVQSLHKADSLGLEQRNQHIKFPRRCCVYIKAKVRSLCKHCTASISPSNNPKWHEVCGIFFFFKQFNFRFGPFGFSGFRLDFRSGSGFGLKKNVKAQYRQCFDSKPPNILASRLGDPGVFHSKCQRFYGHMSHSSVLLGRQILRSAPHLYGVLYFCKLRTRYNKNT